MFYKILRFFAFLILKILFRVEYTGTEKIPETGAFIIASNHSSYLDPVVLAVMSKRAIHFMAKEELFRVKIFNFIFRLFKAFPVDREKPSKSSILIAFKKLKNGNILGMFPEGTRHVESLGKPFYGIGFLSVKNNVPIIPVAISGTDKIAPKGKILLHFSKIRVKVGDLIYPKKSHDRKSIKKIAKDITYETMDSLKIMLQELEVERR